MGFQALKSALPTLRGFDEKIGGEFGGWLGLISTAVGEERANFESEGKEGEWGEKR